MRPFGSQCGDGARGCGFLRLKPHTSTITVLIIILYSWNQIESVTSENPQPDYLVFQDANSCIQNQNQTFSTINLGCVNCYKLKDKNKNAFNNCPCPPNNIQVFQSMEEILKHDSRVKCVPCPANEVTYDQKSCVNCGSQNQTKAEDGARKCTSCPVGSILLVHEENGRVRSSVECIQCADGYTPSPGGEKCIPCHPSFPKSTKGVCKCPELTHNLINDICFTNAEIAEPSFDRSNLYKMEYDLGSRETVKVVSPFLRDNLLSSFYLCRSQKNLTACQLLANMCTLQLHSYGDETNACALYRSTVPEPYHHPPPYIPKLYYLNIEAPSLLSRPSLIPLQFDMNYEDSSSDVNLTVSRVTIHGTFLGVSLLNEMTPCAEPVRVQRLARKFGANYRTSCHLPIQDLWKKYASQNAMEFLDPYLSVRDAKEGKTKLFPVPVKILNFKQRGMRTNEMDDNHQWQLVRRFFFVDTIDGLETSGRDGKVQSSKPVRYLEKIHIRMQLQNSYEPGKIYVPLITLTYQEMDVNSFRRNEKVSFEYTVDYFMDMSRSIEDVKISVGVISSLTVVWGAMQAWSWNRRAGRPYIDITTIANLLIFSCGHLADAFFVVCFGTSLFWFFFFKKQSAVHVLLPQPDQERLIRDLLISAFSLKIVEVLKLISRQVDIDIFFIDWERPRARNVIPSPPSAAKSTSAGSSVKMTEGGPNYEEKSEGNVSIWRTYFIANEWNEIQSTRKIHMASEIVVVIFLLEIVGFKYWGLAWPNGSLNPGPEYHNIPYSTSARFAVGSLVFLLVGTVQWAFRVGIFERFISNKIQDFVDVCTLANVSVFILAANQYGYYIHGRSVHGFSDTCMQTMIEQLNREEEDLCGRRGLLPSTDQQTFLISVPSSFRSVYNQVLQPLYASSNVNLNAGKGRSQLGGIMSKIQMSSKPTSTMLNLSVHAYHSMNRFLTAFLEHALSDLDYDVTDKSFFESTFDMEFGDVTQDRAIFYTDNGHSFDSVLFYGNERTLFLFNLYTFIFIEILSHNYLLAGIITYFIDVALKHLRNYLGKRNLAHKTLIDSRFLI